MEIVSLILGIISLISCWIPCVNVLSFLLAVFGLICGIVFIVKNRKEKGNKWKNVVGIVMCSLAILISLFVFKNIYDKFENNELVNNKKYNTIQEKKKNNKIEVTVIDFSFMSKEEVQQWCKENNIVCNITDEYSDVIEEGLFISQSVNAGNKIYQGDRITIKYSLGREPTMGEKNALAMAKRYLESMPFSYSGLIKQLKYEGFSNEEATYGVDNCNVDWNEQASKMAKRYMDTMSFSRKSLISQLKYEGFTTEQAEYGVTSIGY